MREYLKYVNNTKFTHLPKPHVRYGLNTPYLQLFKEKKYGELNAAIASHLSEKVTIILDNRNVQYHLYVESKYDEVMKTGTCTSGTNASSGASVHQRKAKLSDCKRRKRKQVVETPPNEAGGGETRAATGVDVDGVATTQSDTEGCSGDDTGDSPEGDDGVASVHQRPRSSRDCKRHRLVSPGGEDVGHPSVDDATHTHEMADASVSSAPVGEVSASDPSVDDAMHAREMGDACASDPSFDDAMHVREMGDASVSSAPTGDGRTSDPSVDDAMHAREMGDASVSSEPVGEVSASDPSFDDAMHAREMGDASVSSASAGEVSAPVPSVDDATEAPTGEGSASDPSFDDAMHVRAGEVSAPVPSVDDATDAPSGDASAVDPSIGGSSVDADSSVDGLDGGDVEGDVHRDEPERSMHPAIECDKRASSDPDDRIVATHPTQADDDVRVPSSHNECTEHASDLRASSHMQNVDANRDPLEDESTLPDDSGSDGDVAKAGHGDPPLSAVKSHPPPSVVSAPDRDVTSDVPSEIPTKAREPCDTALRSAATTTIATTTGHSTRSPSAGATRTSIADLRRWLSFIPSDERRLVHTIFPNMTKYDLPYVASNASAPCTKPGPPILSIASFQKTTKRRVIEFIVSKINHGTWFGYYETLIWGTVTEMLHTRRLLQSHSCEDVKRAYRQIDDPNDQERRLIHSVLLYALIKEIVDGNTMLFLSLCVLYYPLNLMCVFESDVFAMFNAKNTATICIGRDRDMRSLVI